MHGVGRSSTIAQPLISYVKDSTSDSWFCVSSTDGFTLTNLDSKYKKFIRARLLFFSVKKGRLSLNGVPLAHNRFLLNPKNGQSVCEGRICSGVLTLYNGYSYVGLFGVPHTLPLGDQVWHGKKEESLSHYPVRVLLHERPHDSQGHKEWHLYAHKGFLLLDPVTGDFKRETSNFMLKIKHKKNMLYVDGKRYSRGQLQVVPKQGCASLDDQWFHGSFMLHNTADKLMLVNHVELEEYIYGVLRTESWPGWPLEVNKVLAIACRSYALAKIKEARKTNKPYHLKNTNAHQTYQGMHNTLVHRQAVEQTKGVFLAHQGEPILAMFDSCCGSVVPAHIEDFNFKQVPYLARSYACTHCKGAKIFSWQKKLTFKQLHTSLRQKEYTPHDSLHGIAIKKKDKAGIVQEVLVKSAQGTHTISGKQFFGLMDDIKSFCFDFIPAQNGLRIKGRGYGHHLGLCQWGAREMVRNDWPCKKILQFYYPGTEFSRLG